MKLKSFHWTRRTAVYALIALAVVLALLTLMVPSFTPLAIGEETALPTYAPITLPLTDGTSIDGRAHCLSAGARLGGGSRDGNGAGDRDPACVQRCIQRLQRPAKAAGI